MVSSFEFAVMQFASHQVRGEALNIALIVNGPRGIEVLGSRRLDKISAISAAVSVEEVRDDLDRASDLIAKLIGEKRSFSESIQEFSLFSCLKLNLFGSIVAHDQQSFDEEISRLLTQLVEPEPAPPRPHKKRDTGLKADIRHVFKNNRLLAKKGDTLQNHRVISNHPISDDVVLDFALQNGALHAFETVDVSDASWSVKRAFNEFAISVFTLELAKISIKSQLVKPNLIYRSSSSIEEIVRNSLDTAESQGITLFNWNSNEDKIRLLEKVEKYAAPSASVPSDNASNLHSSALPNRLIN